jgi:hypothetical protein
MFLCIMMLFLQEDIASVSNPEKRCRVFTIRNACGGFKVFGNLRQWVMTPIQNNQGAPIFTGSDQLFP